MAFANYQNNDSLDSAQLIRYQNLTQQFRCLVCQNQDLADSDAPLAKDLKQQIREAILNGQSDESIKIFLTQRYGEFVLFQPTFSWKNSILWVGPFIILIIGCLFLFLTLRNQKQGKPKC